jgi:hypothetical protein
MKLPRKMTVALLAGVTIAGIAGASASSLGGATSGSVGSENVNVGTCDNDGVRLDYGTTYSSLAGQYVVNTITVSGVAAACEGLAASITLKDGTGAALATPAGTVSLGGTDHFSFNVANVSANALSSASIIISG